MNGPTVQTLTHIARKQEAQAQQNALQARFQLDAEMHQDTQMQENRRALARLAMDFYIIEAQGTDAPSEAECIDKALAFMDKVGERINARVAREAAAKAEAPAEPVKTA